MREKLTTHIGITFLALILLVSGCTAAPVITEAPPATRQADSVPTAESTESLPTGAEAASEIDTILSGLEGLTLAEFFDQSFIQLALRSPEGLTAAGVSAQFGLRDDRLDDMSAAYVEDTQALESGILDILQTYDRESLTPEEQVSYDVYEWHLETRVQGHAFVYHDYLVHHFVNSYNFGLESLFTQYHPLTTRENAEDFITRLWAVDDQVDQLLDWIDHQTELGIIPPRNILDMTIWTLENAIGITGRNPDTVRVEQTAIYQRFDSALDEISGLSEDEKADFREGAQQALRESFVPAYVALMEALEEQYSLATDDPGAWKLPDGDAYYTFMLRQETSTDLAPEEIHQIGLEEVTRIQAEMREIFDELGYPTTESLQTSMARAVDAYGYYSIRTEADREAYISEIEGFIAEMNDLVAPVFDLRPQGEVIVVGGPMGGYYSPGASDGSRPGAYHVRTTNGDWIPKYGTQTTVYHEVVPGHHYQIALAQEMEAPIFRQELVFNGFAEGWALYSERLAWELGVYDNNPYSNLGRLELELLRAVRLVVDTGLHAMHWTRAEGEQYLRENLAYPEAFLHEVDRYVVMPAQATGYKIGMLQILALRQQAMDELGDDFDLTGFHNVVIGHGSLPLDVLERLVLDWIEEVKG